MRISIPILFFLLLYLVGFGQDTTFIEQHSYSGKLVSVVSGADTIFVSYYKSGKIESVRQLKNKKIEGYYNRWYKNGQLMWKKNMLNNQENGNCTYYNEKGNKVAEFNYKNGVITDTVLLNSRETLLFGKATWYSVVHGGVFRGENTSTGVPVEQKYPYMNYPFLLVKIKDSSSIPVLIDSLETDAYGTFFLCLPKGSYGFFPPEFDMKTLSPGQYCPPVQSTLYSYNGWNMKSPLKIEKQKVVFFNLHYSSVVNAP